MRISGPQVGMHRKFLVDVQGWFGGGFAWYFGLAGWRKKWFMFSNEVE